jgi:hypothetical protein
MNSKVVYAALLTLTLLIVLPVLSTVNATSTHQVNGQTVLFAAGSPGPPPTPHLNEQSILVAAGSPGPPPVPWVQAEPELVAAGSPGPPPTPQAIAFAA